MRFRIQKAPQGDIFVKIARRDDLNRQSFRVEYQNTTQAANARHPVYGRIAPKVLDYVDDTLYLEHLSDYRDALSFLVHNDGSISNSAFIRIQEVGAILAFIHDWKSSAESRAEFPSSFPLNLDQYLKMNPFIINILGRLQKQTHRSIKDLKRKISISDTNTCHIHGDFKPDNILLTKTGTRIIDWELAGQGCPEHDFASFYAGIFTELIYRAAHHSNIDGGHPKQKLSITASSAVLCTGRLISAYCGAGGKDLDIDLLAQLIGAKLLVRTAMNNYLTVGDSPFVSLIQQSAEHCLNRPEELSRLLSLSSSSGAVNATI